MSVVMVFPRDFIGIGSCPVRGAGKELWDVGSWTSGFRFTLPLNY